MSSGVTIDQLWNPSVQGEYTEYCTDHGINVVTYPLYRAVQVIWLLVAIVSLGYVSRVYWMFIKTSKLHRNIQILLTMFLWSSALINLIFGFSQLYQLILPATVRHPCEVFLPMLFYKWMNIAYGFSIELLLLNYAAMALERVVATACARSYEHVKGYPAFLGIAISVIMSAAVEVYLYYGETFTQPQISILESPAAIKDKLNTILICNTACSLLTTCVMVMLTVINRAREKRTIGVVSYRFQIVENMETTEMIAKLSFIQVLAFLVQSFGSFLIRRLDVEILPWNSPFIKATKLVLHVIPLFTLLMAGVIEFSMRSTAANRRKRIKGVLNTDAQAEQQYSNYLAQQWDQGQSQSGATESSRATRLPHIFCNSRSSHA